MKGKLLAVALISMAPMLALLAFGVVPHVGGPSSLLYFKLFRLYAFHVFIEDHWREGYAFFFLTLGLSCKFASYLRIEVRRIVSGMIASSLALILLYCMNTYIFHSPVVLLTFLFRVTYFLKPLLFIIVVHGFLVHLPRNRAGVTTAAILAWTCSALLASVPFSEALCLVSCALIAVSHKARISGIEWFLSGVMSAFGLIQMIIILLCVFRPDLSVPNLQDWFVGMNLIMALIFILTAKIGPDFGDPIPAGSWEFPSRGRMTLLALPLAWTLLFGFFVRFIVADNSKARFDPIYDIVFGVHFSRPHPEVAPLFSWVRTETAPGAFFVIPLADGRFANFRLAAERGVYATSGDINQVSFNGNAYLEAQRRLTRLHVTVLPHHALDFSGFNRLRCEDIRRLHTSDGVDYFITHSGQQRYARCGFPAAYEDKDFRVLDLRDRLSR